MLLLASLFMLRDQADNIGYALNFFMAATFTGYLFKRALISEMENSK